MIDFSENLADLADYAFHSAQKRCLDCHGYHALWGYERLSGVNSNDVRTDADILEPLLCTHLPPKGRILIAGAADAGLLAYVAQALSSVAPRISVADRCATPLVVCERYAETHDLPVKTVLADLTKSRLELTCDLAFVHNTLLLQSSNLHAVFLRNIRHALTPDGTLVLVHRVRPINAKVSRLPPGLYADRILNALIARNVVLPESRADFLVRLEALANTKHAWFNAVAGLPDVEAAFAEAGLRVEQRIDHERRRTIPDRDGGEAISMPTYIFVARRRE